MICVPEGLETSLRLSILKSIYLRLWAHSRSFNFSANCEQTILIKSRPRSSTRDDMVVFYNFNMLSHVPCIFLVSCHQRHHAISRVEPFDISGWQTTFEDSNPLNCSQHSEMVEMRAQLQPTPTPTKKKTLHVGTPFFLFITNSKVKTQKLHAFGIHSVRFSYVAAYPYVPFFDNSPHFHPAIPCTFSAFSSDCIRSDVCMYSSYF